MAEKSTKTNYWISYSDLIAGLLFVFLAIIVVSNLQYKNKIEVIGQSIELRKNIAIRLIKEFQRKKIDYITVDEVTGDIEIIEETNPIWFEFDKSELLPKGQLKLKEFIPIYLNVLFDENITKNKLERILIEGHASFEYVKFDQYLYNLRLSGERAHEVGKFILENNFATYETKLKKHLVTLGRSYADAKFPPIKLENGKFKKNPEDWRDRKVLIRFTLQYEKMMRELGEK